MARLRVASAQSHKRESADACNHTPSATRSQRNAVSIPRHAVRVVLAADAPLRSARQLASLRGRRLMRWTDRRPLRSSAGASQCRCPSQRHPADSSKAAQTGRPGRDVQPTYWCCYKRTAGWSEVCELRALPERERTTLTSCGRRGSVTSLHLARTANRAWSPPSASHASLCFSCVSSARHAAGAPFHAARAILHSRRGDATARAVFVRSARRLTVQMSARAPHARQARLVPLHAAARHVSTASHHKRQRKS
jgi:hypothetical protein